MTRWLLMGLLATTAPSHEWTDGKLSAAGLIGYGIGFDSPNAYGLGFGVRGGYTFPITHFPFRSTQVFHSSITTAIRRAFRLLEAAGSASGR